MLQTILQSADSWSSISLYQVVSVFLWSCQLLTEDNRFPVLASMEDDILNIFS